LISRFPARRTTRRTSVVHELDDGTTVVWELLDEEPADALLAAPVHGAAGLVDAPRSNRLPARRHRLPAHAPGPRDPLPPLRRADDRLGGETHYVRPGEPWFESGPEPVLATASATEGPAFARVLLLPPQWAGKRTITYVDPADEDRPKLQRPTVYGEYPIAR
jgi:hypothetical protein